jgi:hypothetical protein
MRSAFVKKIGRNPKQGLFENLCASVVIRSVRAVASRIRRAASLLPASADAYMPPSNFVHLSEES